MMTGALQATGDLTVRYASDRSQFGRVLRRFQAIEHQLAVITRECAVAEAAVEPALCTLLAGRELSLGEVAAAKVVCARAADRVVQIAHQVHGAIGITREHSLSRLTRRLLAWSGDYGTARAWATAFGRELAAEDPWRAITTTGAKVPAG